MLQLTLLKAMTLVCSKVSYIIIIVLGTKEMERHQPGQPYPFTSPSPAWQFPPVQNVPNQRSWAGARLYDMIHVGLFDAEQNGRGRMLPLSYIDRVAVRRRGN